MDTLTPTKRRHDGSVVGGVQLFAPAPALLGEQLAKPLWLGLGHAVRFQRGFERRR